MNGLPKKLKAALTKKATGFTADEIVEEYGTNADGDFVLLKKKVTKKYYPPDTVAIKSVAELSGGQSELGELSESRLLEEKQRLLSALKESEEKRRQNE